jgi:hypothetical protein
LPTTKSLYYTSPFFFVFKDHSTVEPNSLLFNSFLKPNSENRILAMTTYNDKNNSLEPIFSPNIILHFSNALALTKTLEFALIDSQKKPVLIEDFSQLYIVITIY